MDKKTILVVDDEEEKGGRIVAGHVLFTKPYDAKELVTTIRKLL